MPTPVLSDDECQRRKIAIEAALKDGYAPFRVAAGKGSSVAEGMRRIGLKPGAGERFVRNQEHLASVDKPNFLPDWSLYQAEPAPQVVERPEITVDDRIKERRLEQENSGLRRQVRDLMDRAVAAEDLRTSLLGLSDPLEPVTFQRTGRASRSRETVILFLSDLQWGEVISLAAMDGINSYSPEIARQRLERVFKTFVELCTTHWAGEPPERIILILGGDMISGEIHDELAKTNGLLSIPALKDCASCVISGITYIREHLDCPIDILSVPGNHGRVGKKPESKLYAEHSYDTLVADLVELHFKADGRWPEWFRMWKPVSGDALIWVYGYRFLITHGDRIGSRGGAGFVGAAATIARGFKKLVMDYAGRGIPLDFIMCGHFHVALELEEGICNGSLPGIGEYARDYRFKPKPCSQTFLAIHPKHGVTQRRLILPGTPEEGAIYEPKEPPKDGGKPRFRIPAIGTAVG